MGYQLRISENVSTSVSGEMLKFKARGFSSPAFLVPSMQQLDIFSFFLKNLIIYCDCTGSSLWHVDLVAACDIPQPGEVPSSLHWSAKS